MINVFDTASMPSTATPEGGMRTVLGPNATGTRAQVALLDLEAGRTLRLAPSGETRVAYVLEGDGAVITHTKGGMSSERRVHRRAGVYVEPGEQATIASSGSALRLFLVTVPKHTGRATDVVPPSGYVFQETELRSLVDEKRFRERTFWVNKETGLSGSWDLQLGRMQYAPKAHSPRHVHHPSKTSPVVPEHFYFIEKGTGEVKHDTGSLSVGPGCLVLIPSGEWHQLVASDTGFDYVEFQAPFDFMTTMDHDPLGKNWYIKGTDDGTGKPKLWVQS
jgi:mannose-6-phosphate isomerase-like protein (cupin superfamily)